MSIDLSQFHAVFFEESFEGLDVMENALLELQPENPDSELINSIFRSAHSIKGGSGTFGFISISEFTHILETLLDKIREGEEQLDADSVELFLQSVDCMRTMLEALQAETEPDTTRADQLAIMFQSILTGASAAEAKGLDVPATGASPVIQESVLPGSDSIPDSLAGFHIEFTPEADMLKGGNDPVRMMRELATLGELTSTPDTGALPTLRDMQPDVVYLNWCMDLHGDMPLEDVQEVFEWVEGECDLSISRLGGVLILPRK